MKRFLAPILLLVLLFPSIAMGGEVKFEDLVQRNGLYYQKFTDVPFDGKVTGKKQGSFKNGKRHGPWVWYWDNGQLRDKGTYKNGKKDGPWIVYLKNGIKNEVWSGLYNQGTLFTVYDLLNKDGISYYQGVPFTGKVSGFFQGKYKDGKREGQWSNFNHEYWFTGGGDYKDGLKDGVWFDYYDNGQLYYRGEFNGGKEGGPWITYWSNGQIYKKGNYKNGIKEGPWEFYDTSGQSTKGSGTYKNGVKVN